MISVSADSTFFVAKDNTGSHEVNSRGGLDLADRNTLFDSKSCCSITKTRLYNFDPLNFYIVKLGFTGVYIIFLISAQNIDCGYSLEPPHRSGSYEYLQSMF